VFNTTTFIPLVLLNQQKEKKEGEGERRNIKINTHIKYILNNE